MQEEVGTRRQERRVIPIQPAPAAAGAAHEAPQKLVSLYEKQKTIHPRSVHGWFSRWRWVLVWMTQLLFYGLPWLTWNGRPAMLFDLAARRFYIFDFVLYPQDFIYLTGLLVICAYALFFFTAVAGRLWCCYAWPQVQGNSGKRSFFINQSGDVLATNGAVVAYSNAVGGTVPTFEAAYIATASAVMGAAVAANTVAQDGNTWVVVQ